MVGIWIINNFVRSTLGQALNAVRDNEMAADAMTVQMFKWYGQALKPRNVKHIRIAHQRGLGRMDIANLNTKYVTA